MVLCLRDQGWALWLLGRMGCCGVALRRPGDLRYGGAVIVAGASRLPQGGVECPLTIELE